ncbi:MAG: methionyl-tRNA formyltransferase, partial [Treponema sp.]|nr:methionyl-tRNA formyltransferase [Treponema sp.]
MRILFAGSPGIALPALRVLADLAGQGALELAGVLTNPDSPRGRHGTPEPTEVGAFAEERSLAPVLKPAKLDAGAREAVAALEPDLLLSFAYGRIFGPKFLALFPGGGINIHPSLLPRYRGPTPIQAAILNRDTETGISIQRIAPEMDAGDILAQERIPLSGRETAASLGETVAGKGAAMLAALCAAKLQALAAEGLEGLPQDHSRASYCGLISREMGRIDWTK